MSGELEVSSSTARVSPVPPEACARVRQQLAYAADLLQAPRVLMIWEELEEPWVYLAMWSHTNFDVRREPPGAFEWLVAKPLMGHCFLCPDVGATVPTVLHTTPTGLEHWFGLPVHPKLQEEFLISSVLSPAIRGASFEGRLFFLDRPSLTADQLALADLAACKVAANFDQSYLHDRSEQLAITKERQRLARNLHDGVLQSFTVISLQLQALQHSLEDHSAAARRHLDEVQRLVADEQRDLRSLVQHLQASGSVAPEPDLGLGARLETMCRQIEDLWGIHIEWNVRFSEIHVPPALAYEMYYIIHEALLNAARHAKAVSVSVELTVQNEQVHIVVSDNGHGFPFHGHYDLAVLMDLHLGPAMLRERVAALGGGLSLESSAAGSLLDIHIPVRLMAYSPHDLEVKVYPTV